MNRAFITAAFLTAVICGFARNDTTQLELRMNPQLELDVDSIAAEHSFINLAANHIDLNGADWSKLPHRYAASHRSDTVFTIVYIGDSHVQADFGTGTLRETLAAECGSAGRGLIIPFRLAGTNEPRDYRIQTDTPLLSARLLRQPWPVDMPYTGIGIGCQEAMADFNISANEPFSRITPVFEGEAPVVGAVFPDSAIVPATFILSSNTIVLDTAAMQVRLKLCNADRTVIGGFILEHDRGGTMLHAIGNNGATSSSYNGVPNFAAGVAGLYPDLIVVALGTNEAFGSLLQVGENLDVLIKALRHHNPQAQILLTTPTECMRRTYTRTKNRKRRRSALTVNTKAAQVRKIILDYAKANNLAVYDTYAVAGGAGAATKMQKARVLGSDGVHFTAGGYKLRGQLLAKALIDRLAPADKEQKTE